MSNLHTEASVDLYDSVVVFPNDTELYDTLWHLDNLEGFLVDRVLRQEVGQAVLQLIQGLVRVAYEYSGNN